MRNETYNLKLNLPNKDELVSIHPISRGPYAGHDVLMVMDNLRGRYYVVRATLEGEHLSTSETVRGEQAKGLLVAQMIKEQNERDLRAVNGGGPWSCE